MREVALLFVLPVLLVGCTFDTEKGADENEGPVAEVKEALLVVNALSPNALSPNALSPNALSPNALSPNALSPNALSTSSLNSIKDPGFAGELSRLMLKYLVSCSLDSSQSWNLYWTDGDGDHTIEYAGALGLAPNWADRGLTVEEQRWVSACMGSRTNYYGVSIMISIRGTHPLATADGPERTSFPVQEGAFWGNLFDATPWLHSCHNAVNVTAARDMQRDCAAGHLDGSNTLNCGMIERLGTCSSLCTGITIPVSDPEGGFASCNGTAEALTTYLSQ